MVDWQLLEADSIPKYCENIQLNSLFIYFKSAGPNVSLTT